MQTVPTRWIVLAGLIVARLAFAFQFQSVAVVASGLMQGLALDVAAVGTLTGLFMLPGLVLAIPGGVLSNRIGERRFLVGCLAAMVVGGAICGFAEGYWPLWLGRLLSGFGAIGINVAMSKIVIDWFAGHEINTAMALFLSGYPAGIALALVTLGHLATPAGWPVALWSTAGFSFIALVVFALTYRPAPDAARRPDAEAHRESRLSLAETGMVCLSGLIWGLYNAAYIIVVGFVPLYLVARGIAPGTAAALVGLGLWVAIVAAPFGGALVDRTGRPNLIISACVLTWGFGMLLTMPLAPSVPLLAILFAVTALIGNLPIGPIVALSSEVLRPEVRGIGMGVFYTWLYGGLALGPMLAGHASKFTGDPSAPLYLVTALAVLALAALGLFRLLQGMGYPGVPR